MLRPVPAAVVTGAGRGIGLEIARRLAARGYAVNLTDVDVEAAAQAAERIGGDSWASELDVTDLDACRRIAAEAARSPAGVGRLSASTPPSPRCCCGCFRSRLRMRAADRSG
jgi:NAD(P)-dependent dehydrogenase (short-subunit alcohol dehydrogenase family)